MKIDTLGLIDSVGYTKTAANFLVEYGLVTPDQGTDLVKSVHTIKAILETLPSDIQTNSMTRTRTSKEMLKWMTEVEW